MSEWKEDANKRRDFRQDPESKPTELKHGKRKKKRNFKVEKKLKKGERAWGADPKKWYPFGYYKKEADAKKAIKSYENKYYWNRFEYRIEDLTSE